MRLLNTKNLELVSKSDNDIPPYAILSHTWGSGEVSLQDMQGFGGKLASAAGRVKLFRTKKGLKKVIDAAKLASSDGYEWIWIDTCCIDKTSSAELSEAINSMYRWYENSGVCYVYLEDVEAPFDDGMESSQAAYIYSSLSQSRWVTRGWTLQELIAPQLVQFHSRDWVLIGKKIDRMFQVALATATGIEIGILSGQTTVAEVSVANRMKWAWKRQTTRFEDAAYCLMGIFAVNMPLLYGEGEQRAFRRLQEEILKTNDDQSIFAWKLPTELEDSKLMSGLLANSPAHFGGVASMRPMSTEFQSASSVPWTMTNKGLQVQLYIRPVGDSDDEEYLAILDCCIEDTDGDFMDAHLQGYSPSIRLRRLVGDQYTRIKAGDCEWVPGAVDGDRGRYESFFVKQNPGLMLPRLAVSDSLRFQQPSNAWQLHNVFPSSQWSENNGTFRLNHSRLRGIQAVFRFGLVQSSPEYSNDSDTYPDHLDVVIVLKHSTRGELEVKYFPSASKGDSVEQLYYKLNRLWSAAPNTPEQAEKIEWIEASQHYQEAMRFVIVELINTMRAGRGLYLLNIREKVYSELDPAPTVRFELHGESIEDEMLEKARNIVLINSKTVAWITSTSRSIKSGHFEPLLRPSIPMQYSERHRCRKSLRDEINEVGSIIDHTEFELCQAVIHGHTQDIEQILARPNSIDSTFRPGISPSGNFRAIHFASLTDDPQIMSLLIEKGLHPLTRTRQGHTAMQLASILGNSSVIQPLLKGPPRAEVDLTSISTYHSTMAMFRPHFGSEIGTGNTALHLAAMCCSGEEFRSIVVELFKATGVPESKWDDIEASQEREYLFCLRNDDDETVLHSAIDSGNLEVVELICFDTPDAATRLDSFSRSAVWHAASRGDTQMFKVLIKACSLSKSPPYIHLADDNGVTPLHVACWGGHLDMVKEILNCGGTHYQMTKLFGLPPAAIARKNDQTHVAEFMERLSATGFLKTVYMTPAIDVRSSAVGLLNEAPDAQLPWKAISPEVLDSRRQGLRN